ncbi:MAG: metalloregulator ArsR/SmtB family transcription factor [Candidatus Eisenbacteria bacterium]|nr:metalloregulator ArsR/SmtB family transcription factor [Candidatus Eisenbacteria bacterium]
MKVSSRDAVRVFRALSDVTRVEIVQLLGKAPKNVTELTSLVGVSQPKVSRHLKILRDAGLLKDLRRGKWVWYELAAPGSGDAANAAFSIIDSLLSGKEPASSRPGARAPEARRPGLQAAGPQVRPRARETARAATARVSGGRVTGEPGSRTPARREPKPSRKAGPHVEKGSPQQKEMEDFLL